MFDINFYQKSFKLLKGIQYKKKRYFTNKIYKKLEKLRSKEAYIYNIETTNACNMKCKMCPRTTKMTRKIRTIDFNIFCKSIEEIKPHSEKDWKKWEKWVKKRYGIDKTDMSENHFFLYIIPQVIQLHGYGDPLLDPNMSKYIKLLHDKGFKSYFSCNPTNINIKKTIKMFESGLDYIKYSIESVDDKEHKKIRGEKSNFSESYKKICKLLKIKKEKGYKTTIIITMLDLNRKNQLADFEKLKEKFKDKDVYIYLKSEDQQWYRKDKHGTNSVHWSEICKHPWMSTTIKSNGEIVMCMEDYNNEIVLGDLNSESLKNIWNGLLYDSFRYNHLQTSGFNKCHTACDMLLIGKNL